MKKLICFISPLWLLPNLFVIGQTTFARFYETGGLFFVTQTSDKGFICKFSPYESGFVGSDIGLLKTDSIGTPIWTKRFGEMSYYELGGNIIETSDMDFLLVGEKRENYGSIDGKAYLIRVDSNGNALWERMLWVADSASVDADEASEFPGQGYIIAGRITDGTSNQGDEHFLAKISFSGEYLWGRKFYVPPYGYNRYSKVDLCPVVSGGYLLAGNVYGAISCIKVGDNGDMEWSNVYKVDSAYTGFIGVETTADGGFVILGNKSKACSFSGSDFVLLKIDASGLVQWCKKYIDTDCFYFPTHSKSLDGGFCIIAGFTSPDVFCAFYPKFVVRFDSSGNLLWSKGNFSFCNPVSIQPTSDSGFVLGNGSSITGNHLIKIDSAGSGLSCISPIYSPSIESAEVSVTIPLTVVSTWAPQVEILNTGGGDFIIQDTLSCLPAKAEFTYTLDNITAQFTNISSNGEYYSWQFGDDSTSQEISPSHTFSSPGTYDVCLSAYFSDHCDDYLCDSVNTLCNSITVPLPSSTLLIDGMTEFTIYPNPAKTELSIFSGQIRGHFDLALHSLQGSCLVQKRDIPVVPENVSILDISTLPKGIYFLTLTDTYFRGIWKVVKE